MLQPVADELILAQRLETASPALSDGNRMLLPAPLQLNTYIIAHVWKNNNPAFYEGFMSLTISSPQQLLVAWQLLRDKETPST